MLQDQLEKFIYDTQHPEKNFDVGFEYEKIDQWASAIGYYYSCVDKTTEKKLQYECLLRIAKCFGAQGERMTHEKNTLLMAIDLLPNRVEAYHALAQFYGTQAMHKQGMAYAKMGLQLGNFQIVNKEDIDPLYTDVGYKGIYQLKFEYAVSLWHVGRFNECREAFRNLLEDPTVCDEYRDMIEYNISQCLVHGKLDIVLQGPYSDYALDTAYQYLDLNFVNEVIISCWEDDIVPEINHDRIRVVKSPIPDSSGTGNRNLQIVSSLAGVKQTSATYVVKMRNDQRYTQESMIAMNDFFNANYDKAIPTGAEARIFTAGYFKDFPFHPRDHLYWGHRADLIKLFDIPLEDKGLHEKLNIEKVELSHLYDCFIRTETYIAAHYYARFDPSIKKYLLMPERYLYDDAPFMEETMAVSNKWKKKIFMSFPRKGIDLEWPTYDWTTYPYDNQKKQFSERWHEDGY